MPSAMSWARTSVSPPTTPITRSTLHGLGRRQSSTACPPIRQPNRSQTGDFRSILCRKSLALLRSGGRQEEKYHDLLEYEMTVQKAAHPTGVPSKSTGIPHPLQERANSRISGNSVIGKAPIKGTHAAPMPPKIIA